MIGNRQENMIERKKEVGMNCVDYLVEDLLGQVGKQQRVLMSVVEFRKNMMFDLLQQRQIFQIQ